jgi:GAF domain-containing protein
VSTLQDADDSWLGLILRDALPDEFDRLRSRQLADAATEAQRRRIDAEAVRAGHLRVTMIEDRRRVAELNALTDLALRLSSEHNLTALLQDTVTQARRVLDVDVAYLALAEPDGSLIIRVTDGSIGSRLRGVHLPPRSGLAGLVLERAEPVQSADYVADEHLIHTQGVDQVAVEEGLRTIVGAPLRLRGEVTGVLMVAQRAVRRFNSWELSLLCSLGAFAGVAIDNAKQMESHRRAAEELSVVNADLEETVASVNRATVLHDRLLDVALRGGGVDQVVSSLSEVVQGLVSFADDRDIVVAAARASRNEGGAKVADVDGMTPIRRFAAVDRRRTWIGESVVTVPVASANAYFGCLQVRPDGPLAARDVRLLERAAMTIALVAQADRAAMDADRRSTDDMLEQIFGGRADDGSTLRKRSLLLGLDLTAPHVIAVAEIEEGSSGGGGPLDGMVRRVGGVSGRVGGRSVAAVPASLHDVEALLEQSVTPLAATIGMGGPASGAVGLASAYQDALACLKALRALERARCWASPADLGPYRFLLSQAGRSDAERFVDATIGSLVAHDEARHTSLVRTADVFLAVGRQHTVAAAELHIHANTLYQRLDRINAILGEGWRDRDRALELQMAMRMRRLLTSTTTSRVHPTGDAVG